MINFSGKPHGYEEKVTAEDYRRELNLSGFVCGFRDNEPWKCDVCGALDDTKKEKHLCGDCREWVHYTIKQLINRSNY